MVGVKEMPETTGDLGQPPVRGAFRRARSTGASGSGWRMDRAWPWLFGVEGSELALGFERQMRRPGRRRFHDFDDARQVLTGGVLGEFEHEFVVDAQDGDETGQAQRSQADARTSRAVAWVQFSVSSPP